jgi:hypothetical protein
MTSYLVGATAIGDRFGPRGRGAKLDSAAEGRCNVAEYCAAVAGVVGALLSKGREPGAELRHVEFLSRLAL